MAGATLLVLYSRVKEIAALQKQNPAIAGLVSLPSISYINISLSPTATFEPLS